MRWRTCSDEASGLVVVVGREFFNLERLFFTFGPLEIRLIPPQVLAVDGVKEFPIRKQLRGSSVLGRVLLYIEETEVSTVWFVQRDVDLLEPVDLVCRFVTAGVRTKVPNPRSEARGIVLLAVVGAIERKK